MLLMTTLDHCNRRVHMPSFDHSSIGKIITLEYKLLANKIQAKLGFCVPSNSLDYYDADIKKCEINLCFD